MFVRSSAIDAYLAINSFLSQVFIVSEILSAAIVESFFGEGMNNFANALNIVFSPLYISIYITFSRFCKAFFSFNFLSISPESIASCVHKSIPDFFLSVKYICCLRSNRSCARGVFHIASSLVILNSCWARYNMEDNQPLPVTPLLLFLSHHLHYLGIPSLSTPMLP